MVTLNLPHNNVTMAARLMYSLGLLCSYPLQVMPAFEISEKTSCFEKLPQHQKYPRLKSIIYRSLICLFTGLFSIMVPKFGLFLNFSGAFSMTFLAFIMPVSTF
jgi:proton-coupled amino acid transporter